MTTMSSNLALRYRPVNFQNIVGQRSVSLILEQMVLKDIVPHALLLSGDRGTGKTSCARILAAALNCDIKPGPCGSCTSCSEVFSGSSLAVTEIDAASHGAVFDIRKLKEQMLYSVYGKQRVVILDEVQMMSREAFNALLKLLEEPPSNTVFVLVTTEAEKIPGTVLSRCMEFSFNRISQKDICDRLQFICEREGLNVNSDLLVRVAEHANGGLRDAVMVFDQVTCVGIRAAKEFDELFGLEDYAPALLSSLVSGDVATTFALANDRVNKTGNCLAVGSDLVRLLCELLVLQSGGPVSHQGAALEVRRSLAKQTSPERLVAALKVLWAFRSEVRTHSTKSDLDLALIMMRDVLMTAPSMQTAKEPVRMTLSDMQSMVSDGVK